MNPVMANNFSFWFSRVEVMEVEGFTVFSAIKASKTYTRGVYDNLVEVVEVGLSIVDFLKARVRLRAPSEIGSRRKKPEPITEADVRAVFDIPAEELRETPEADRCQGCSHR